MGEIYKNSFPALIWLEEVVDLDPIVQEIFQPRFLSEGMEGQPENIVLMAIDRLLAMNIATSPSTWQRTLEFCRYCGDRGLPVHGLSRKPCYL